MSETALNLWDDEILRAVATFDPSAATRAEVERVLSNHLLRDNRGRAVRTRGYFVRDFVGSPLKRLAREGFLVRKGRSYTLTDKGRRHVADPLGITPPREAPRATPSAARPGRVQPPGDGTRPPPVVPHSPSPPLS